VWEVKVSFLTGGVTQVYSESEGSEIYDSGACRFSGEPFFGVE